MGLPSLITSTKNFSMILMGNSFSNLTPTGLLKHFTMQSKNCVPIMFHSVVGFHLYIWASEIEVAVMISHLFIVWTLFLFSTAYTAMCFLHHFSLSLHIVPSMFIYKFSNSLTHYVYNSFHFSSHL